MARNPSITIATLNTQGTKAFSLGLSKKCRAIADYYNNESTLDIINFQEIFVYHHLFILKELLTSFPYCIYKPAACGPTAGLVTFSRRPLLLRSYQTFHTLGSPWNRSVLSIISRRGMLISHFDGSDDYILNTHFSPNYSNDWDTDNSDTRILGAQVGELRGVLSQLGGACIATGDFNIHKGSFLYDELLADGLIDIFPKSRKPTHRGDAFIDASAKPRLDYILYNNKKLYVSNKIHTFEQPITHSGHKRIFASDHIGLQATLKAQE